MRHSTFVSFLCLTGLLAQSTFALNLEQLDLQVPEPDLLSLAELETQPETDLAILSELETDLESSAEPPRGPRPTLTRVGT